MPAYNCEKYVAKAIESILNQSYQNFELLIADDCSIDQTKKIINSFTDDRIKTHHNDVNLGYLKASNNLFSFCKGEFITFQDADDWSDSLRIEKLLNQFNQDEELYCVGSFVVRIDQSDNEIGKLSFKTKYEYIKAELPQKFNCVGSALMIKRDVLIKIGLYNEAFDRIGSEDLYWFGLIAYNFKVANINIPLYFYRDNPNSVSKLNIKSIEKSISKDLATEALIYFKKNKKELFINRLDSNSVINFLKARFLFSQNEFLIGFKYFFKSFFTSKYLMNRKLSLLNEYKGKFIK